MDNYTISILDNKIKVYSPSKDSIIKEISIVDETFNNGKLLDSTSLQYSLKKVFDSLENNSNICIIFSSENNIFRTHEIPNLKSNEIDEYFKYNKESIIPFDTSEHSILYKYDDPILEVYGVEDKLVELLKKQLSKYKFKNIILTLFPSLVTSYARNNKISNLLYINFQENFIEYCGLIDFKVQQYGSYKFNKRINPINFDVKDKENSLILYNLKNMTNKIIDLYKNNNLNDSSIFAYGNKSILGIYNISNDSQIIYKDLIDERYFTQ